MNASHDDNLTPLDPAIESELYGLLARLCDNSLTSSERERINHILSEHSAARRLYLRYIAVHGLLTVGAGNPLGYSAVDAQLTVERLAISRLGESISATPLSPTEVLPTKQGGRLKQLARWFGAVSAVLLAAAAIYFQWPPGPAEVVTQTADNAHRGTDGHSQGSDAQRLVAEVTFVSESAVWQTPNSSYALASHVRAGQSLALVRGQVELTYETGVKLLLTGPTDFLVQAGGGKLRRGELVARVPKAGHGFTIETPQGKVVDLGTEFGVMVDDFGVSQVSVFEGKVETMPAGAAGKDRDYIELTSGSAIQWTDTAIIPIDFQARRYQLQKAVLAANPATQPPATVVREDFRSGSLPEKARWNTLGHVAAGSGLRLGSTVATGQRPYLLSAREFDPTKGAVTVQCDVRFENVSDVNRASLAILTRSSNRPSKAGTAWHDMLARAMRCRLNASAPSGEGVLEAGTKQEPDCAPTNLSWGGFSRPQAGKLYHLEMRDDGLNVSFTVSLAENPSVYKTITCRSLFRSNENYIAIEGTDGGTAIVEQLAISQELSPLDEDDELASASAGETSLPQGKGEASIQTVGDLIPADAELVLEENFDGVALDSATWTALGDIVMKDGRAQLGLPNDEQHIDTWREHPYLITRQQFDPARGTLTIIGDVTFAENFLHGYGGTFSVMTRAASQRGGQPGWTSSILQRGIRCNVWPAAFGFDHSLEIHEKPVPDTITLLTAAGLRISPRSRAYWFKVVDDGRNASLTLIDANKPQVRKTIGVATLSKSPTEGHLAFESCWGSPIQLDNVRVYRSKPDASQVPTTSNASE